MSLTFRSPEDKFINLKSKDGKSFPIRLNSVKKSTVIARLIDDLALDTETGAVEIPLTKLKSEELKKVVEYLDHHADDTASSFEYCDSLRRNQISDFDVSFIQIDQQLLLNIFNAANYLDIQILKDLCAWTIAESINGKTYVEINQHWDTKNDFTEEELLTVQHEYEWINQRMR